MSNEIPTSLAQPAQRALRDAGITTLDQLANFTEKEITALHGMGPGALKRLREAMDAKGVVFKQ
jgi:predicted flap endonuclease-1-like 5' DNA nuclease